MVFFLSGRMSGKALDIMPHVGGHFITSKSINSNASFLHPNLLFMYKYIIFSARIHFSDVFEPRVEQ